MISDFMKFALIMSLNNVHATVLYQDSINPSNKKYNNNADGWWRIKMDDENNYEAFDDLHQNDTVRFSLTLC